ncbi:MAG: hypothetical protein J5691_00890 [Bacilli bacterium]|nr:hypothetical protein [Bacilli bacterium]
MKDEVRIEQKGNNTYMVIVNGWELFTRTYMGYDSKDDVIEQLYQDIYSELKITEEEFNKQFVIL